MNQQPDEEIHWVRFPTKELLSLGSLESGPAEHGSILVHQGSSPKALFFVVVVVLFCFFVCLFVLCRLHYIDMIDYLINH